MLSVDPKQKSIIERNRFHPKLTSKMENFLMAFLDRVLDKPILLVHIFDSFKFIELEVQYIDFLMKTQFTK